MPCGLNRGVLGRGPVGRAGPQRDLRRRRRTSFGHAPSRPPSDLPPRVAISPTDRLGVGLRRRAVEFLVRDRRGRRGPGVEPVSRAGRARQAAEATGARVAATTVTGRPAGRKRWSRAVRSALSRHQRQPGAAVGDAFWVRFAAGFARRYRRAHRTGTDRARSRRKRTGSAGDGRPYAAARVRLATCAGGPSVIAPGRRGRGRRSADLAGAAMARRRHGATRNADCAAGGATAIAGAA